MPNQRREDNRTRVVVVEPLGDGGIAHYAYNLVRALIDAGNRPMICTTRRYEFSDKEWPQGSLRTSLFRVAFSLIRIFPGLDVEQGPASLFRRMLKLMEYPFNALETVLVARMRGIGIVHLQTVNTVDLIIVVAARLAGMKVVTTVHNVNPLHGEMTGLHQRLLQWMYDMSHRLIIHTDSGKVEICELFGLSAEKITVIPHGDYSFFVEEQGAGPDEDSAPSGEKDLLFFGAIRPNKGLDLLLEALPLIRREHPGCRLRIVGEPVGGFDAYREIIDRLGLGEVVDEVLHYVGNDEVAGCFTGAAVVVLPYREITQSGVIQIAFACGTPVVAADLAGFREIIEDGVNGLLVDPEDAVSLSSACCQLLAHPDLARQMGTEARRRINQDYSWDRIAARTATEVYQEIA